MRQFIRVCLCLIFLHCAVTSGNATYDESSASDEKDATDYLSSVAVAITPNTTDSVIAFCISGDGQEVAMVAWRGGRELGENRPKIISVFDDSLELIREFQVPYEHASHLTYGSDGLLYTAGFYDYQSTEDSMVYVYKSTGENVSEFKTNGTFFAFDIVASEGLLYLTYWGIQKILIYNEDGTYEASIEQGLDAQPKRLTVTEDKIYVSSAEPESIYIFDKNDYTFIRKLPYDQPPLNMNKTTANRFAVDDSGNMIVPDFYDTKLVVVDANYERVGTIGTFGTELGEFTSPNGVSLSPDADYFITLERSRGLQKFEVSSSD